MKITEKSQQRKYAVEISSCLTTNKQGSKKADACYRNCVERQAQLLWKVHLHFYYFHVASYWWSWQQVVQQTIAKYKKTYHHGNDKRISVAASASISAKSGKIQHI